MTKVDLVVLGQGIGGSALALEALRAGLRFVVIDNNHTAAASRFAGGLINPIAGQRFNLAQFWEDSIGPSRAFFKGLSLRHDLTLWRDLPMLRVFATETEHDRYVRKFESIHRYDHLDLALTRVSNSDLEPMCKGHNGGFRVDYVSCVDYRQTLDVCRAELVAAESYSSARLEYHDIRSSDGGWLVRIAQEMIWTPALVFAEGWQARANPFFKSPWFELSAGEAAVVTSDTLPRDIVLSNGIHIVPRSDDTFWIGSTFRWGIDDPNDAGDPEASLRQKLNGFIEHDVHIVELLSGVRPTTFDRAPVIGPVSGHKGLHVFNGLGTRGALLAPWLAKLFIGYLIEGADLPGQVSIERWEGWSRKGHSAIVSDVSQHNPMAEEGKVSRP